MFNEQFDILIYNNRNIARSSSPHVYINNFILLERINFPSSHAQSVREVKKSLLEIDF